MVESKILHGPNFQSPKFAEELEKTTLDNYLIEAAKQRTNNIFLIDGVTNEELKTEDFLQRSYSLAGELQQLGCKKGTMVGTLSENRVEYSIVVLGTMLTGATLTCLDPHHSMDELKSGFNITKPTIMFCSAENYDKVTQLVPMSTTQIVVFDSNMALDVEWSACIKFSQLIQSTKTYTPVKNEVDDTALVMYSSGTTGLPKGVMLTHKNIVFILKLSHEELTFQKKETGIVPSPVQTTAAPMFHPSGLIFTLGVLKRDLTLMTMPKFDAKLYLAIIEKYKIQHIIIIPTLLVYLLKNPLVNEYDLSCLESASCGTAALKSEVEEAFKRKFGLKYIQQMYGLTECTLMSTVKSVTSTKSGTCGSVIPGVQMKIVHTQTGEILANNEMGEIRIRGPHVMKGYYGNEQATADAFDEGGWLRTGDVGYYDEDGDFFIVDRIKDIIKHKSYQVPPTEVETLLLTHPAVADCGVIGILDEEAGELARAYVVKRDGVEATENEIMQFVAERISLEKRLSGGVEFVSGIPRNMIGKILRIKLRELWKQSNHSGK